VPERVASRTCAPGMRPDSGAKLDVSTRTSCSESSAARFCNPPNAVIDGSAPPENWAGAALPVTPVFALTPSRLK